MIKKEVKEKEKMIRNGKGIIFYSNGKIKYKGDWTNGRREGIGHSFTKNGKYYIGQWSNNLRNGKGTLYYSNGNIEKEGNWVNDGFVGN